MEEGRRVTGNLVMGKEGKRMRNKEEIKNA